LTTIIDEWHQTSRTAHLEFPPFEFADEISTGLAERFILNVAEQGAEKYKKV